MKTMLFSLLLLCCISIVLFDCKNKDNNPPNVYESCCGTQPTTDSVLLDTTGWTQDFKDIMPKYARVYVPNILVLSDTDPLNGLFMLFANAGVVEINTVKITAEDGTVYFEKTNTQPNSVGSSWAGLEPDGSIHRGLFKYDFEVLFVDGQIRHYIGQSCVFKCGDEDFPLDNLPNCFFPFQNNGNGQPDRTVLYPKVCF